MRRRVLRANGSRGPNFDRSRTVDRVTGVLSQVVLKDDPLALSTGYQLGVPGNMIN